MFGFLYKPVDASSDFFVPMLHDDCYSPGISLDLAETAQCVLCDSLLVDQDGLKFV